MKMTDGTWRVVVVWGLHLNEDQELAALCHFLNASGTYNGVRCSVPVRLLEELDG